MMKPAPDELYEEDERLSKLFFEEKAYDDVDGFVRRNASKEFAEWFFAMKKERSEAERQGISV